MSSLPLPDIPSFRKQQLRLEFARLKAHCPQGIYLSLSPGDTSIWSGVLFVREGPYTPAVLRFQILFPDLYPELPPLITFSSDVFHPLVVSLTTHTFSTGTVDPNETVSATDEERLPPGAFSLRQGFPFWFGKGKRASDGGRLSPRCAPGTLAEHADFPGADNVGRLHNGQIIEVLEYLRSAFQSLDLLDGLPFEAAANSGAWHAWRSHRGLPKALSRAVSPEPGDATAMPLSQKHPGDWNWDGVWEKRVRNGIDSSISDATLFGSARGGAPASDTIRFRKLDDEQVEAAKAEILGLEAPT